MEIGEIYRLVVYSDIKHWGAMEYGKHMKWEKIGEIFRGMMDGYMEECVLPFSSISGVEVGKIDGSEDFMEMVDRLADELSRERERGNEGVKSYIDGMIGELNRVVYLYRM